MPERVVRTTRTSRVVVRSSQESSQQLSWLLPLFLATFVVSLVSLAAFCHLALYIHRYHLHSYINSLKWTFERREWEETFPRLECDEVTTTNPLDLVAVDATDATDKALLHGAVVLSNLISQESATNLRNYILERNPQVSETEQDIDVIMPDRRVSFTLSVHDEHVRPALVELGRNTVLQDTLESLLGTKTPAIVELHVITSYPGAVDQYWHADTEPDSSHIRYGESIVPLYSLLIPFQDTTPKMGATAVCPGSHYCHDFPLCQGFVNTSDSPGFQFQNGDSVWKAGDGLLYNSQTRHRGSANYGDTPRVVLILGFTSKEPNKLPPMGTLYAIDELGLTLGDLSSGMYSWWTCLYSFECPGWSTLEFNAFRAANQEYGFRVQDIAKNKLARALLVRDFEHRQFVHYEYMWVQILRRLEWLSILLSVGMAGLFLYSVSVTKTFRVRHAALSMVVVAGVVYILVIFVQQWIHHSTWAVQLSANTIVLPYIRPVLNETYIRSLPTPLASDIFIVDQDYSAAVRRTAAHHSGSRRWRRFVNEWAPDYLLYPSNTVVEAIVDMTTNFGAHRFLKLNSIGDWEVLSRTEARDETRRALHECIIGSDSRISSFHLEKLFGNKPIAQETDCKQWLPTRLIVPTAVLPALKDNRVVFRIGMVVQAREFYGRTHKWVHAKIVAKTSELYYDIEYHDIEHKREEGVHVDLLRSVKDQRIMRSLASRASLWGFSKQKRRDRTSEASLVAACMNRDRTGFLKAAQLVIPNRTRGST